jgi:glycine cleavage system transcriptional repressor
MPIYALSAIGRDRPGIVAGVTMALLSHDVNIEDSQMTILRGHFTMMLVLRAPQTVDPGALRADLDHTGALMGLEALTLADVSDAAEDGERPASHVVSVYGADHTGIVHAICAVLAEHAVNVCDLQTRLVDDGALYAMLLEIVLPDGLDPAALRGELEAIGADQDVEVTVRELGSDTL